MDPEATPRGSRNVVLTSIVGGKDSLIDHQAIGGARFVCFTDRRVVSATWEVRPAYDRFSSHRRNSRAPKIIPHRFVEADISLWIDGHMRLRVSLEELAAQYLGDCEIAVFRNPFRNCLFEEAEFCARELFDDPQLIEEQANAYAEAGHPRKAGLCACGFILRRHTAAIETFNNAWWTEYCRYSARDQISFMYVVRKLKPRLRIIDLPWTSGVGNSIVRLIPHLTLRPEPFRAAHTDPEPI